MIPGRLSHRREFNPVPPLRSAFVYMTPPKNGATQTGVSSARLLHWSENFVLTRNLATVNKGTTIGLGRVTHTYYSSLNPRWLLQHVGRRMTKEQRRFL